jgi:hypothetical protein
MIGERREDGAKRGKRQANAKAREKRERGGDKSREEEDVETWRGKHGSRIEPIGKSNYSFFGNNSQARSTGHQDTKTSLGTPRRSEASPPVPAWNVETVKS